MGDESKVSDFIIDSQLSYFLHLSDAGGAIITRTRFDGKNFDLREKVVTTALTAKTRLPS